LVHPEFDVFCEEFGNMWCCQMCAYAVLLLLLARFVFCVCVRSLFFDRMCVVVAFGIQYMFHNTC